MDNFEAIMDQFRRLHNQMKRRVSTFTPGSYGHAQGRVLRTIAENNGIRSRQLATLLGIRPATLTEHLDHLESEGQIKRVRDQKDARVIHIQITEDGKTTIQKRHGDDKLLARDFKGCLSEEEAVLFCGLCERMSQRLEQLQTTDEALADQGVAQFGEEKEQRRKHQQTASKTEKTGENHS